MDTAPAVETTAVPTAEATIVQTVEATAVPTAGGDICPDDDVSRRACGPSVTPRAPQPLPAPQHPGASTAGDASAHDRSGRRRIPRDRGARVPASSFGARYRRRRRGFAAGASERLPTSSDRARTVAPPASTDRSACRRVRCRRATPGERAIEETRAEAGKESHRGLHDVRCTDRGGDTRRRHPLQESAATKLPGSEAIAPRARLARPAPVGPLPSPSPAASKSASTRMNFV